MVAWQCDPQSHFAGPVEAVQVVEQVEATVLQHGADFGFVAQRDPKPHRQHADSAMDRLQSGGMKHRRDGMMRCVDKSTCQLFREAPAHVDGSGSLRGHAWHVSTAADAKRV